MGLVSKSENNRGGGLAELCILSRYREHTETKISKTELKQQCSLNGHFLNAERRQNNKKAS